MSLLGAAAGTLTGNVGLYVVGGLVLAGAAAVGTQTWRLHSAEAEFAEARAAWSAAEADLSRRALEAEHREREKEQAWSKRFEEIDRGTTEKLAAASAAASAADLSARSVRDRAQALAARGRRACSNPAAPGFSASAPDALDVFADVLGRADARAGVLAATADRARIAGLACEAAYDELRKPAAP